MQISFSDGTLLRVPSSLMRESSRRLRALGFSRESGGLLVGVKVADEEAYELRRMSYPGRLDRRFPFAFLRSRISANRILQRWWNDSAGRENYLGEWHTHNVDTPIPSTIDIDLMGQVAKDGSPSFGAFFMLIIGNSGTAYIEVLRQDGAEMKREGKVIPWLE